MNPLHYAENSVMIETMQCIFQVRGCFLVEGDRASLRCKAEVVFLHLPHFGKCAY